MKKRTAFICAILSLIPLGHPLLIKTGVVLSTTGFMLYVPEKAIAGDIWFYLDRAESKGNSGDWYGAISEFNKALKTNGGLGHICDRYVEDRGMLEYIMLFFMSLFN